MPDTFDLVTNGLERGCAHVEIDVGDADGIDLLDDLLDGELGELRSLAQPDAMMGWVGAGGKSGAIQAQGIVRHGQF